MSAEGIVGGAAEAAPPALRIQHLSKTFGGAKALDSVTLKSLPGSTKQYTQAQIDDPFNPPDSRELELLEEDA